MTHTIVRAGNARITATPNATMTTLASPTVNESKTSLWIVEMQSGAAGPLHTMSSDQVWHLLTGTVSCEIAGEIITMEAGDTLRISGGVNRQFQAESDARLLVSGASDAVASTDNGATSVVPGWIS